MTESSRKPLNKSDYGGFTCVKCHVAFPDGEAQREHFRSDWHRYNLKRNVADLPPVTAEAFRDRVLTQRAKDEEQIVKTHDYCMACKKSFNKHKAYLNHIQSKKHIEAEKNNKRSSDNIGGSVTEAVEEEEMEVEEVDSDEWEGDPIPPTDCLFCCHHSATIEKNLSHMTLRHSFFIPDLEYCVDLDALLTYLGKKVGCGLECLWCNEKSKQFWNMEAVQNHMLDKGHCMMKLDGDMLLECSDFYDFSSSYPDDGLGRSPDEEIQENVLSGDDYQLILPSGAVIGHRSLNRYYRQHLDPSRSAITLVKSRSSKLNSILSEYKALGWKGATEADIKRKARDLKFMHTMRNREQLSISKKANKMQHHFRVQCSF